MRGRVLASFLFLIMLTLSPRTGASSTVRDVDVLLVLAIDTSSSITADEYGLQMSGYANAFRSREVASAIRHGPRQRIAVTVVHWCGLPDQAQVIPWTIIDAEAGAAAFASALESLPRRYSCHATWITGGIDFSTRLIMASPLQADRKIIDISGDGVNNTGSSSAYARDEAVYRGIVINGLAIADTESNVAEHYRHMVIGGFGGFVVEVASYADFPTAVRNKLVREIAGLR